MALDAIGTTPTAVLAVALVVSLGVVRTYAGGALLSLRFVEFWGTARRIYMPVVDRLAKRVAGVAAENHAHESEHVADVDHTPREIARALDRVTDRVFEVSVLSGLKTDWDGHTEVASIVAYAGPKPFPGAPNWLRREQIHVFMFRTPDGRTRIAAHREANAYRPDKWKDHLRKGPSFDADAGVQAVRGWLEEADRAGE